MKHKQQSEYVNRTQRQYETALTPALKYEYALTYIYFSPAICFILVYNCGLTVHNT